MARNVISLILGLVVAFVVIAAIQSINFSLFPIPPEINQNDSEAMNAFISTLPFAAHFIVYIAHVVGTLVSVFVASKVTQSHHVHIAYVIAGFLLIMSIINITQMPHPTWFVICDTLSYIPCAILGRRIAGF